MSLTRSLLERELSGKRKQDRVVVKLHEQVRDLYRRAKDIVNSDTRNFCPRRSVEKTYGRKLNMDPVFRILSKYYSKNGYVSDDLTSERRVFLYMVYAFTDIVLSPTRINLLKTEFLKDKMVIEKDTNGLLLLHMLSMLQNPEIEQNPIC